MNCECVFISSGISSPARDLIIGRLALSEGKEETLFVHKIPTYLPIIIAFHNNFPFSLILELLSFFVLFYLPTLFFPHAALVNIKNTGGIM